VARERWLLGGFVALVLLLNRTFVGRGVDHVLTLYGAKTWALVALLVILLSLWRRGGRDATGGLTGTFAMDVAMDVAMDEAEDRAKRSPA
jgi:hypothetical protein